MHKHLVFVYGSLRKGSWSHSAYLTGAECVGIGRTVRKYAMYFSYVPYVYKREQQSHITGEVYAVNGPGLQRLDELEDHPTVYQREEVEVELEKGKRLTAWMYFYPERPGRLVPSGDFFALGEEARKPMAEQ